MNDFSVNEVGRIWKGILRSSSELCEHEKDFFPRFSEIANSSERILEIGIWMGRRGKLLRRVSDDASHFYGVDLNWRHEVKDVFLTLGDTRYLPFPDNSFDLTYSLGVVEHMPTAETASAVHEHIRVTRKGGYILITTSAKSLFFTALRNLTYFIEFRELGTFTEVVGRNLY